MKTKEQISQELVEKYWLCDDCAQAKGLYCFKTGNTLIKGRCGHCERPDESWLTPIVDLRKKKVT